MERGVRGCTSGRRGREKEGDGDWKRGRQELKKRKSGIGKEGNRDWKRGRRGLEKREKKPDNVLLTV